MGRQVNVCLTSSDVKDLERKLRRGEDFRLVERKSNGPRVRFASGGLDQQQQIVYLVRNDDIPLVRLRPIGRNRHRVDVITAPVVEFMPCSVDQSEIRPGRLYFTMRYFEGEELVEKSNEFSRWAQWVLARCRRLLESDRATRTYWGDEAARLREASQLTYPRWGVR